MSGNEGIKIGKATVGGDSVFIIAEISANHGHNFRRAANMIKEAKNCGADAVKFQTYTPETMTINCNNRYFRINHPKWGGRTLYQLYKKTSMPWSWFKKLKNIASDLGIIFFSTAFDKIAVDFLEELNVPAHKIASYELVDLPLIEYAAKTKKPLILSTGMATLKEIAEAVNTARNAGAKDIILLKCVSNYPADPEEINLKSIPYIEKKFKCPVGLSDHTLGIWISIAAASLGAKVIEKHFTISRKIKTADSFFSIEPYELKTLIKNIRIVEEALGVGRHILTPKEKKNRLLRRSLFAVEDIEKGEIFTHNNIRSIRPGYGLPPKYLQDLLGRRAKKDLKRGTPLTLRAVK